MSNLRIGRPSARRLAPGSSLRRPSVLVAVTALIYLVDAVGLCCGALLRTPGTHSAPTLGALALIALTLSGYAVLRGRRFTRTEATVMLGLQVAGVAAMSHTTHLDLAALGNGFGLSMLGAYATWLLTGPASATFYAGLSLWVAAVAARDNVYLTVAALLLAGQAVVTTEIVRLLRRRVRRLTDFDPLTGILNRRGIEEAARVVTARSAQRGTPVCVALIDLDDLRHVNNTVGHSAGDALLVTAADEWRDALHGTPVTIGRIGGDEFVLLFDGVDELVARGMLRSLHATSAVGWTGGVAQLERGERFEEGLARADAEMYAHKDAKPAGAAGRCCGISTPSRSAPPASA